MRYQRRAARIGTRVVGIADEVGAAFHLGRVRPEQRRIGRPCAGSGCHLEVGDRAGATEVGVRVVDPGIDDRDLDAFGAPMNGTLTALFLRCFRTGKTSTTPGSAASCATWLRSISILIPFKAWWK